MSPGSLCPSCGVGVLVENDGVMECSDETCGARRPLTSKDRIGQILAEAREGVRRAHEKHHPTSKSNEKRATDGSV